MISKKSSQELSMSLNPRYSCRKYRAGEVFGKLGYVDAVVEWREATMYLTERGVRVVGTDGWSWDAPLTTQPRSGLKTVTLA